MNTVYGQTDNFFIPHPNACTVLCIKSLVVYVLISIHLTFNYYFFVLWSCLLVSFGSTALETGALNISRSKRLIFYYRMRMRRHVQYLQFWSWRGAES